MADGLDKKAIIEEQARAAAERNRPPALEPPFPYRRMEFDPVFFGVADEPEQAPRV